MLPKCYRAEKALPKSPRKKTEILGPLAKKYQLCILMNKKRGRTAIELTDEEKQWIWYSLDRADLTYVNPGRKNHVYIEKKDGKRQYCQNRYLLWNLRDLLNILNGKEVAGSTAGVETFVDRFEKLLSFSLLPSEITNNLFITRTFRTDCASVRCVKILVFLPKASKNVSKV